MNMKYFKTQGEFFNSRALGYLALRKTSLSVGAVSAPLGVPYLTIKTVVG
jgi:hypothetical protein